jgi:hypothetical protein
MMNMLKGQNRLFLRIVLSVSFILTVLALVELLRITRLMGVAIFRSTWTVILAFLVCCAIIEVVLFGLTWHEGLLQRYRYPGIFQRHPRLWRPLSFVIFGLSMTAYPWLVMSSPYRFYLLSDPSTGIVVSGWQKGAYILYDVLRGVKTLGSASSTLTNPALHLLFFWMMAVFAALVLKIGNKDLSAAKALLVSMLSQAVVYKVAAFLPGITSYPFSLGWSETSRYYYASLLFAERIYGAFVPLSVWHPTRYFLQSLPFITPGLPLQAHRLWQVLLWLGMTGATSFLLARRLRIKDDWIRWSFVIWAVLFLFQGAVYYHLLVCIWLVLAGFSPEHPARSLLVILAASFWAGMSRLNWFPVPAMLAGALYFLEKPLPTTRSLSRYLLRPALWLATGTLTAVIAQWIYIRLSGNQDLRAFGSSLTSDLLWYRLWPNPTYPPGVVPGILLVVVPSLALVFWFLRGRRKNWSPWRLLGLAGFLILLLAGGLVVSTKIGGGGDLHNMDAFMVFVLIMGSYIFFDRFTPDRPGPAASPAPWTLVALAVMVPVGFVLVRVGTLEQYDPGMVRQNLESIKTNITVATQKGEVLFITQRHLLTFGLVEAPLVPEYEVVTLMEMAMSGNTPYLDRFYADLHRHRFQMIVAGKQFLKYKGRFFSFGEENDAWVQRIALPLTCEYQPALTLDDVDVQLFVPNEDAENCLPNR